ncbi:MAG TPA: biosynthetic arginine decarboxylase [Elusimicrobiota bacterium]|nr:biosynthetic arginine decarboxylase [Elusimicrobiota bacterium]
MAKNWTIEDSASLYNLKGWGLKYFGVNEQGHLVLHPRRSKEESIDIKRVLDDVLARGIKLPILLRFQDLLRHRVAILNEEFKKTIEDHKYQGRYYGVYPIKVNQLREVVEEIHDAGEPYQYGLEAGSKGELMVVLAMNGPEQLTIVNGYKDESMMKLAMVGLKLGKKVIVVIEKLSELDMLLKAAKEIGVRPLIGLRSKLETRGSGKWKTSTGHAAKFGLTTPEILAAVRRLRAEGLADCVKLLHFHIGSQVTEIQTIKDAVKEGARVYAKLRKMKVGVEYLDCGGGLGVDYDGTHTASDSSMNYTIKEYVGGVVYGIQEVCRQEKVPEPHIVTESGRSLVAHHSLLVVNIFGSIEAGSLPIELQESPDEHEVVREMRDILKGINPQNLSEAYHDAEQRKDEAFALFKLGYLELEDRAKVENLYWRLCLEAQKLMPKAKYQSEDLDEMAKTLDDQYLCNFSLFQSLPDSWAINHIFPIVPLHRLNEEPERKASMVDITCDSDGKIDQFAYGKKLKQTLPLHRLDGKPYYVGIFLMGAYQATMGDIHNLFGRVNEVHVFEDDREPGGYYVEEIIHGQTVRDVLTSIQYGEFELVKMLKASVETQVKAGKITPREGVDLLDRYEAVMQEYTYIDHLNPEPQKAPEPAAEAKPEKNGAAPHAHAPATANAHS